MLDTRYRGVVDQIEASTSGFISASPVGLLIPLPRQYLQPSWITFLDPVVLPGINLMVEVILLESLVLYRSIIYTPSM